MPPIKPEPAVPPQDPLGNLWITRRNVPVTAREEPSAVNRIKDPAPGAIHSPSPRAALPRAAHTPRGYGVQARSEREMPGGRRRLAPALRARSSTMSMIRDAASSSATPVVSTIGQPSLRCTLAISSSSS